MMEAADEAAAASTPYSTPRNLLGVMSRYSNSDESEDEKVTQTVESPVESWDLDLRMIVLHSYYM